MNVSRFRIAIIVSVLLMALGAFALSQVGGRSSEDQEIATLASIQGEGILDGNVFLSKMGPAGQPADVQDHLVFGSGLFVSSECQARCDYPARPYFTRYGEDGVHFVSETKCPYKNARIIWRGVIRGNQISGEATWRLKRWYWSIERTFWFEGELIDNAEILAQNIPVAAE